MATIFDVSDVVLEEPVTGEKENGGKTRFWCGSVLLLCMHATAGEDTPNTPSRGKDVEAQNQYALTSEGNLALFEVSFCLSLVYFFPLPYYSRTFRDVPVYQPC